MFWTIASRKCEMESFSDMISNIFHLKILHLFLQHRWSDSDLTKKLKTLSISLEVIKNLKTSIDWEATWCTKWLLGFTLSERYYDTKSLMQLNYNSDKFLCWNPVTFICDRRTRRQKCYQIKWRIITSKCNSFNMKPS